MLAFLGGLFDGLEKVSTSQWFYLIILGIAFLDSVVPVVPSETAVILGGIAAGQGHLNLVAVIACGAIGAMLGDNTAYSLGHRFSDRIQGWYAKKPKRAKQLAWAEDQLRTRGGSLLLTARFIPGGRTVITVSSGITRQPRRRFVLFVALACIVWASYAAILGFVAGEKFKDNHTKAFIIAFAAALAFSGLLEVVRHLLKKRKAAAAA
jgi:membrane-associated protein